MPTSVARTAICSAPLECPSSPGLPTTKVSVRPSRPETSSTLRRTSSSLAVSIGVLGVDAGRRTILAEHLAQDLAPFAGGDAGFGRRDRRRHDIAALGCRRFEIDQRLPHRLVVAPLPP